MAVKHQGVPRREERRNQSGIPAVTTIDTVQSAVMSLGAAAELCTSFGMAFLGDRRRRDGVVGRVGEVLIEGIRCWKRMRVGGRKRANRGTKPCALPDVRNDKGVTTCTGVSLLRARLRALPS